MPLFVIGEEDGKWNAVETNSGKELLELAYEKYQASSKQFLDQPIRTVPPDESLYVGQRECAVVPRSHADEGFAIIGSDYATTCHVMILQHRASGTVSVTHFDGTDTFDQVKSLLDWTSRVLGEIDAIPNANSDEESLSFDAYLIGGFDDARSISRKLSEELLRLFQEQPSIEIRLKLACITKLNTIRKLSQLSGPVEPWPAVYGAAIDLRTNSVFPCVFKDRGPELELRETRYFSDEKDLLHIYDHKKRHFVIKPFKYYPLWNAEEILNLPDEWILQNLSTSPSVEPPDYAQVVRDMLKFMIEHPSWRDTFKNGTALRYEKKPGLGWVKISDIS